VRLRKRLERLGIAVGLVTGVMAAGTVPATAASVTPARTGQASSVYDWAQLHRDASLSGYAANGGIDTTNASSLGVRWGTDLYSAVLSSPVVAWNATLGKTLVYVATMNGTFYALDKATGAIVWADQLGNPIVSTPLVSDGYVWVGTATGATIYKIDATTGKIMCSRSVPTYVDSSPVAATLPNGQQVVFFAAYRNVYSFSATSATCATNWTWSGEVLASAVWDPLAYAMSNSGEPLVVFGDANPDDSVYAVDAVTGTTVWHYATTTGGDNDVGSGVTVSAPGVNGFADGVAYVPAKNGYVYALDLQTGALIWDSPMGTPPGSLESLATAALDGTNLVVGEATGVYDFNAVTGKAGWTYTTPTDSQLAPAGPPEVVSSPAISGAAGSEVVAFGDLGNAVRVLSMATGSLLYSYPAKSWITSSPAVSDGDLIIGSSDGYLYDFSAGGGNTPPATTITSPAPGQTLANPHGNLTVTGVATDATGVASVMVAIRQGGSGGLWWHPATSSWSASPNAFPAALATGGGKSTTWSVSYQVPLSGNDYQVDAYATSTTGAAAVPAASTAFFVNPAPGGPTVKINGGSYLTPNSSLAVTGTGFTPGQTITISVGGQARGSATATTTGQLPSTTVTVPVTMAFGATAVVAADTSGKAAATALVITNRWDQHGGSSQRSGDELTDSTFDTAFDPGDNILLNQAWQDAVSTAALSPAVVENQHAYVGDASGNLYSVLTTDGASTLLWKTPDGTAITSAPAVNAAANLVYVPAADGDLYAVYMSGPKTGTTGWTAPIGAGTVFAPAYDSASVYAATTDGSVKALDPVKGTVKWTYKTATAIVEPPAEAPGKQEVVIPTTNSLVMLTTAGQVPTACAHGYALTAQPTSVPALTDDAVAYVGTSDGQVVAVHVDTCTKYWAAAIPTATSPDYLQGTGALTLNSNGSVNEVWIGSQKGRLYAFNGATGHVDQNYGIGTPVNGVAIAGITALLTTNYGRVYGVRTWPHGGVVWSYMTSNERNGPPAIVDGTMYTAGGNGHLLALTPYGAPPQ
jgi:outer membrane protein assembly factor BamB